MSKFKKQGFSNTLGNSFKGIRLVVKSERNIKIHFLIAIIAIFSGIYLKFSMIEFCILLLTIGMVIIAESLNSAIEFALDAVFKNKYSKLTGMAKDIAAGAVMLATVLSVTIGILLYGHAILEIL